MFEGVDYHNQSKHFLYTANPGPTLNLPDYMQNRFSNDAAQIHYDNMPMQYTSIFQ